MWIPCGTYLIFLQVKLRWNIKINEEIIYINCIH